MDWAEDLKLSIKKSAAKKGRRAPALPQHEVQPSSNTDTDLNESPDLDLSSRPPRKITGGWAESATKSGKNHIEDERFKKSIDITPDDEIPIIPDLDDIQDELLMNEIVEPPSVTVNRVVTLKELNSELLTQKAFTALEDVDLSILTKCLVPVNDLDEADEPWEWEKTFTEIIAEVNDEKKASSDLFKDPVDEIGYVS